MYDPNKGENGFLHNEVGYGQFHKVKEIKNCWYKVFAPSFDCYRWCGEKSKNLWSVGPGWNFYFIDKEDAMLFKLIWR